MSELNLDKSPASPEHGEPPGDSAPSSGGVLDHLQRGADAMSYSGINGVMQVGEMLGLGVNTVRAAPGVIEGVRGYLEDAKTVSSGGDKLGFGQALPTVLAANVSGLGNVAYGMAAGIGDMATRVLTPGAGADRYQQASARLHQGLEQGFERWAQARGVNTDTATYRKAKADAQIAGAVARGGGVKDAAPEAGAGAGATKALAGSADDVIEYGSVKGADGQWVARPVAPEYRHSPYAETAKPTGADDAAPRALPQAQAPEPSNAIVASPLGPARVSEQPGAGSATNPDPWTHARATDFVSTPALTKARDDTAAPAYSLLPGAHPDQKALPNKLILDPRKLGEVIGDGAHKVAFAYDGLVAAVVKPGTFGAQAIVQREVDALSQASEMGFSTVEHAVADVSGQPAILMKRSAASSYSPEEAKPFYTANTLQDLGRIERRLSQNEKALVDLELLVDRDGHLVVSDLRGVFEKVPTPERQFVVNERGKIFVEDPGKFLPLDRYARERGYNQSLIDSVRADAKEALQVDVGTTVGAAHNGFLHEPKAPFAPTVIEMPARSVQLPTLSGNELLLLRARATTPEARQWIDALIAPRNETFVIQSSEEAPGAPRRGVSIEESERLQRNGQTFFAVAEFDVATATSRQAMDLLTAAAFRCDLLRAAAYTLETERPDLGRPLVDETRFHPI